MTSRRETTGRVRDHALRFVRRPARAATASGMPSSRPTHQVAMMPHPIPSIVGDTAENTGGWPMVKYSTQTRAVTWSCRMP